MAEISGQADSELQQASAFLNLENALLIGFVEQPNFSKILVAILRKAQEFTKITNEKLVTDVDHEQQMRFAEQQNQQLRMSLDNISSIQNEEHDRYLNSENKLSSLRSEHNAAQAMILTAQEKISSQQKSIENMEKDVRNLEKLVNNLNSDIEERDGEIQQLNIKIVELREINLKYEKDLQLKHDDEVSSRINFNALKQEYNFLVDRNNILQQEVENLTNELAVQRRAKNFRIGELEAEVEKLTDEKRSLEESITRLQTQQLESSATIENLLYKVKESHDKASSQEEASLKEINNYKRLNSALEYNLNQEKLKAEKSEYVLKENQEAYEKKIYDLEDLLKTEIQKSSDFKSLVEAQAAQTKLQNNDSPTRFGNTPKNYTEVYIKYLALEQEIAQERKSHIDLKRQFDELLVELEYRAPEIEEQRFEYETMKKNSEQANAKIKFLDEENKHQRKINIELGREIRDFKKEQILLNQQRRDLAYQVQNLLYELELQGLLHEQLSEEELLLVKKFQQLDEFYTVESEADELITEKLVKFKNVFELQQQNEKLLKVVRSLTLQIEEEKRIDPSFNTDDKDCALADAEKVVSNLIEEVKFLKAKIESTKASERLKPLEDRQLIAKKTVHVYKETQDDINERSHEQQSKAEHLRKHFEIYKEQSQSEKNELLKTLNDLESQCNKLKAELTLKEAQSDLSNERIAIFKSSIKSQELELEELKKRNEQLNTRNSEQEIRFIKFTEELLDSRKNFDRKNDEVSNLKAERDLSKLLLERAKVDCDTILDEKSRLNILVIDLQNSLRDCQTNSKEQKKKSETTISNLEQQIGRKQEELDRYASDLDFLSKQKDLEVQNFQDQTKLLNEKVSELNIELQALKSMKSDAEIQLRSSKEELDELRKRQKDFQDRLFLGADSAEGILRSKLIKKEEELDKAREELQKAKWNVEQMKTLCQELEQSLEKNKAFAVSEITRLEKSICDKDERTKLLEKEIEELKAELENSNSNARVFANRTSEIEEKLNLEVQALSSEIEDYKNREYTLKSNFEQVRAELKSLAVISERSRSNYEDELTKHSETAENVKLLREENSRLKNTYAELQSRFEESQNQYENSRNNFDVQIEMLKSEYATMKRRNDDMVVQNRLLMDQIDQLSIKLSEQSPGDRDEENDSVDKNYVEIIRTLRREKEILQCQIEVLRQDYKRNMQKLESITNSFEETKKLLSIEKNKVKDSQNMDSHSNNMAAKLQEIEMMRENNQSLREELASNRVKLKNLEQNFKQVVDKLDPLKESNMVLSSENQLIKSQLDHITNENDKIRKRNLDIIENIQAIEPKNIKDLRAKVESLEKSVKDSVSEKLALAEEIESLKNMNKEIAAAWKQKHDNTVESSKARIQLLRKQLQDKYSEQDDLKKQNEINSLNKIQGKLENSVRNATALSQKVEELEKSNKDLYEKLHQHNATSAQKNENNEDDLNSKLKGIMERERKLKAKAVSLLKEKNNLKNEMEILKGALKIPKEISITKEIIENKIKDCFQDKTNLLKEDREQTNADANSFIENLAKDQVKVMLELHPVAIDDEILKIKDSINSEYQLKVEQLEKRNAALLNLISATKTRNKEQAQDKNNTNTAKKINQKNKPGQKDLTNIPLSKKFSVRPAIAKIYGSDVQKDMSRSKRSIESLEDKLDNSEDKIEEVKGRDPKLKRVR